MCKRFDIPRIPHLSYCLGIAVFFVVTFVQAAPVITSAQVSATSLSITGTGFGTKSIAQPIRFDDFENGSHLAALNTVDSAWHIYWEMPGYGVNYSSEYAHSGNLSVGSRITNGESFKTNYFTYAPASTEMFISYWWRTANGDAADNTIIKMTRICSSAAAGGGGVYNGPGNTTLGGTYDLGSNSGPYCAYNNGITAEVVLDYLDAPPRNTWIKVEMYKKLSTPGVKNGIMECTMLGVDHAMDTAALTRAAGQSFLLNSVLLGTMDGSSNSHDYEMYIDDMYIDSTRARIEIGNAATWTACTSREVQMATSWSATQISGTVNRGRFSTGESSYLYVVDRNGAVNANGFPLAASSASHRSLRRNYSSEISSFTVRSSSSRMAEIVFTLASPAKVGFALYTASGRIIVEYDVKFMAAGIHTLHPIVCRSGFYMAVCRVNGRQSVHPIVLD